MSKRIAAAGNTEGLTKKKYMANCMWHIQSAECHQSQLWKRDEDIAEAFLIAAESGIDHAHDYLVNLANNAGNGKYAKAV